MPSTPPADEADTDAKASTVTKPSGPFAKYVGHKVRIRRGGQWIRAVPQDEHSTTTAFGTDFPRGFWVSVAHLLPEYQKKLSENRGFAFADAPASNEPVVKPEDMVIGPIHGSSLGDNAPEYEDEGTFMQSASTDTLD